MPAKGQCKLTPKEIEEKVAGYFKHCDETMIPAVYGKTVIEIRKPYIMEGLAAYMDISTETLYKWLNGEYACGGVDAQKQVSDTLARARNRMTIDTIEGAASGRYDAKIATLILSKRGYNTKQEVTHTGGVNVNWGGVDASKMEEWAE